MSSTSVWVIEGQTIYCQGGLPHRFAVSGDEPVLEGIPAIDRQHAQRLGLDLCGEFLGYRALAGVLGDDAPQVCSTIQLLQWHTAHRHCTYCGAPTPMPTIPKVCPSCQHHHYPTIYPCVIVAITRLHPTTHKTQILLAKHHRRAHIYTLIAGFVETGETLEMTAHREAAEEVGVTIGNLCYMGSQPWPYASNLMVGFHAEYVSGDITPQADEIEEARFFDLDALPAIAPVGTIARQMIDEICQRYT